MSPGWSAVSSRLLHSISECWPRSPAGIDVEEGHFDLQRLDAADEVMALSTGKEVRPIVRIGDRQLSPGPVTAALAERYRQRVLLSGS